MELTNITLKGEARHKEDFVPMKFQGRPVGLRVVVMQAKGGKWLRRAQEYFWDAGSRSLLTRMLWVKPVELTICNLPIFPYICNTSVKKGKSFKEVSVFVPSIFTFEDRKSIKKYIFPEKILTWLHSHSCRSTARTTPFANIRLLEKSVLGVQNLCVDRGGDSLRTVYVCSLQAQT